MNERPFLPRIARLSGIAFRTLIGRKVASLDTHSLRPEPTVDPQSAAHPHPFTSRPFPPKQYGLRHFCLARLL